MKRLCLLYLLIAIAISAFAQNVPYSSWYNEYTHENVSYNLGNGTTFKGTRNYHKGKFLSIQGEMTYANGDKLSGTFDQNLNLRGAGTYYVKTDGYWGGYNKIVHMENGRLVDGDIASTPTNTYNGNVSGGSSSYTNPVQNSSAVCRGCNGNGRCQHCHGTGLVNNNKSKCSLCHGSGTCVSCHGRGKIHL
ncbi:MAG: hypothetical protein NC402_05095 [Prevotella sp.]|nr:hypothetical protein [Prevotella sp.]MCM1074123.1 hypothetical protein [Ruminococcus sp.]